MTGKSAAAGIYATGGQKTPRVQILTAAAILAGKRAQVPFGHTEGFRRAAKDDVGAQIRCNKPSN